MTSRLFRRDSAWQSIPSTVLIEVVVVSAVLSSWVVPLTAQSPPLRSRGALRLGFPIVDENSIRQSVHSSVLQSDRGASLGWKHQPPGFIQAFTTVVNSILATELHLLEELHDNASSDASSRNHHWVDLQWHTVASKEVYCTYGHDANATIYLHTYYINRIYIRVCIFDLILCLVSTPLRQVLYEINFIDTYLVRRGIQQQHNKYHIYCKSTKYLSISYR